VLAETTAELTEPVRRALARAASEMSLEDNNPDWRRLCA
jgi:hypothetical protein